MSDLKRSFTSTILVLVTCVGVILYLLISSTFPFKDKYFNILYPKLTSHAQESLYVSIGSPLDKAIIVGDSSTYITATTPENIKIKKLEVYIDDSQLCAINTPPFVCLWEVPAKSGMRYQILVKAYDISNKSAQDKIIVTVR